MAKPLTAKQLLEVLRAEGVNYVELPGWQTHNRPGAWAPEVFMLHYTAGNYGAAAGDSSHAARARAYAGPGGILWDGRAGVPGPLCHFGIDKAGTVWLTGWGRANHAGRVDATAITLARNGKLPTSDTHRPGADDSDGNAVSYGIEMMTASTPTAAQLEAAEKVMAAVLRAHGWPGTRVIGHGEASRRKTGDPRGVNMGEVRQGVIARLKSKPNTGGFKPVQPTPAPQPKEEDDMTQLITFHKLVNKWTNFGGPNWVAINDKNEGFSFLEGVDRNVNITVTGGWVSKEPITGSVQVHRVNGAAEGFPLTGEVARDNISGTKGYFSLSGVIDLNRGLAISDGLRIILDTTPTPEMVVNQLTTRVLLSKKEA